MSSRPSPAPRADGIGRRALDLVAGAGLLLLLSPAIFRLFLLRRRGALEIRRSPRVGRLGRIFPAVTLHVDRARHPAAVTRPLELIGRVLDLLAGHRTLVGPRALPPGELDPRRQEVRARWKVSPGVVSLHELRARANIDHDDELASDLEYIATRRLRTDLGIAARALVTALQGPRRETPRGRARVSGLPVDNRTMDEALDEIVSAARGEVARRVYFLNADGVNLAHRLPGFRKVLEDADLVLPDGIGLRLGARISGRDIRQNVNGTDLFPRLCARLAERGESVFLLGGRPGVARDVADWMSRHHPGTRVVGHQHGYFRREDTLAIVERVRASGAQVLLVALGAPNQELWIDANLPATGARVGIGVGGLFDFYSGRVPRAPLWIRELGLEWTFRLLQEPGRLWKRYLVGNLQFLGRLFLERLASRGAGLIQI